MSLPSSAQPAALGEAPAPKRLARLRRFLKVLGRRRAAALCAVLLLLIVAAAVLAPWLANTNPYDTASLDLMNSHLPPAWMTDGNSHFLLGTDAQGADLLSLILYGLRTSLCVGLLAVAVSIFLGASAGLTSGYFGGVVEAVLMRLADIQFTFPAMLLALLIGGLSQALLRKHGGEGYSMAIVVLSLGIAHWPHFARLVRAATLVERRRDYVAAARLVGRNHLHIIVTQILPNVVNAIFVLATLDIAFAIMTEATLSFLGFGMPPSQPSLGTLIKVGYVNLFSGEWWVVLFPSAMLVVLLISVNVFGDWLRDYLDPKR